MPYNNSAIPPSEEATGQTSLPMTRIKKIIRLDEDIAQCSNNAAFVISIATEMFIQYLAEQGHKAARSDKRPRRNIQYKDLGEFDAFRGWKLLSIEINANLYAYEKATAVSRTDNLEFLSDVIPKTTTYKQFKAKERKDTSNNTNKRGGGVQKGQTTLNGKKASEPRKSKGIEHMLNASNGDEERPSSSKADSPSGSRMTIVDRTVGGEGQGRGDEDEMSE
ncbi:hypothetical protein FQN54_006090 [Arachnomyces sp. PD_36]|nr:hypothetical protein FQN54_006090 [Arachnomyces sp. PD_36]